ncbi:MAG TPA: uracil phosphoribosyltransferase [Flavobacterium sp.]|nr:uracil phosphoribosyltransferase [Flavobacterium sp.]
MKAFFEGIQTLFVDFLFLPMDAMRKLELSSWFGANIINWIFMAICVGATWYWIKQLKLHKSSGEDYQDTTAHSFLK